MQSELEISTGHTFQTVNGLNLDICGQRFLSCHMCTVGNNDTLIYTKILCNQSIYKITFFRPGSWGILHTGCPRRNVPDFGRVFLMLRYTDITQNTYIQS